MTKIFFILLFFLSSLFASSFELGKEIFSQKCASCHIGYISFERLKKNFFETNNTLLNLKAPTVNMLHWAITKGARKIGEEGDEEFRVGEIADFLEDYLTNPEREKSICEPAALKFYDIKKSFKPALSKEELEALANYLLYYKEPQKRVVHKQVKNAIDEKALLAKAQKENKIIIIEVSASDCVYCTKMKKEVLEQKDIQGLLEEKFIFLELDVAKEKLPFGIEKVYANITPSFFILDKNAQAIDMLVGYIDKKQFKQKLDSYIKGQ